MSVWCVRDLVWTVEVDVQNNNNLIGISAGGLPTYYNLAQFHFHWGTDDHWGAEHTVDKYLYPVEVSVREYVFYVFFIFWKNTTFYVFFKMTFQKVVKSHTKCQVCWMSIVIFASKLPDVIGTCGCLSHIVLSCIVACVHTSEQDVWCWWPWLIGTVPTSGIE